MAIKLNRNNISRLSQFKNVLVIIGIISIMLTGVDGFSQSQQHKLSVDWIKHHSSFLSDRSITDFSNDGLINLLKDTEDTSVAYHTLLLLGRMNAKEAIPAMKVWLIKENISVQIAAAEALIMLGDINTSIETLQKICQENDNVHALDAAGVLARYGFVDAIPYLIKLCKSNKYSYRIGALKHMRTLAEKMDENESSTNHRASNMRSTNKMLLVNRMNQLLSDGDIRVREKAVRHLSTIKLRNKRPILKALKERHPKERNTALAKQIEKSIERLEKE